MNKAALTKPAIGVLVGASLALAASAGASQSFSLVPMPRSSALRYTLVAQATSSTGMPPTE